MGGGDEERENDVAACLLRKKWGQPGRLSASGAYCFMDTLPQLLLLGKSAFQHKSPALPHAVSCLLFLLSCQRKPFLCESTCAVDQLTFLEVQLDILLNTFCIVKCDPGFHSALGIRGQILNRILLLCDSPLTSSLCWLGRTRSLRFYNSAPYLFLL